MSWEVREADCVEAMREMDEASVDVIVTDPPYGLEFMGKEWDRLADDWRTDLGRGEHAAQSGRPSGKRGFDGHPPTPRFHAGVKSQEWHQAWATEALRVLKPGGHLLAFGGTRTYHRLACAVEDAGFEIRDSVIWLYGSGFPKSLDVSKAIDKAAGKEGEYGAPKSEAHAGWIERGAMRGDEGHEGWQSPWMQDGEAVDRNARQYEAATLEAQRWQGWGTALKPAHEPIVVARKPLVGTVAETVSRFGTGALNVDGCRIGAEVETWPTSRSFASGISPGYTDGIEKGDTQATGEAPEGRWPANVALSHLPECERVGERRVRGVQRAAGSPGFGEGREDGYVLGTGAEHGPDGLAAMWACAPGCPVESMNLQAEQEVSRFFLTVQGDTLCVLCNLPCVESVGNPSSPSTASNATVPGDVRAELPHGDGGSKAASDSFVTTAEPSSPTTPGTDQTGGPTAPLDAAMKLAASTVHLASSAGSLCRSCATSTAQRVALWLTDPTQASQAGPVSTLEQRGRTLSRNLALIAGEWERTGITPTTTSLRASFGFAEPVTGNGTAERASDFSRAAYRSKASRAERNAGLEGFEEQDGRTMGGGHVVSEGRTAPKVGGPRANHHPTVKPVELMRWLCRLVTPPEGTLLDPFCGSGTTGIAAALEGFDFIGIEREAEYVEIAKARIAWWEAHQGRETDEVLAVSRRSEALRAEHELAGQMGLGI